jgi:tripeptidyl-peptidase I
MRVRFLSLAATIPVFTEHFHYQSFLTNFRTDLSAATTFGLQTLDGGANTQSASQAGIEAVC